MNRTPLYDCHSLAGARMVPFAGWEMPVQYTGVIEEVRATRERAGLFDVSHMGEFRIEGPGALAWLNGMTTNDVARLTPGRAQYSLLLLETGGIRDDILLYRLADEQYLMVVNASNREADWEWLSRRRVAGVQLADVSDETALIAVQGPGALALLQPLATVELAPLRRFGFVEGAVAGVPCLISRTGYTGEDGFELFTHEDPVPLWEALVDAGADRGTGEPAAQPCGLGARDVLRLEAGNVLYGHEIGEEVNPLAAGLGWVIKLEKGPFIGSEAIARIREEGPACRLVGLTMLGRAIPRQGYPVLHEGSRVGEVTSGTFSPTLGRPIGMAFVPARLAEAEAGVGRPTPLPVDTPLAVEVRGRPEPAVVTALPFYKGR